MAEHRLGRPDAALTGLLLGADGRWSAARLPPVETPVELAPVELDVDAELTPGGPIPVSVRVRGPAWSGVFRVLAVDASSSPTPDQLRRWLGEREASVSALDTMVTAAFDAPAPDLAASEMGSEASAALGRGGRPGRAAVSSSWLTLSGQGYGYTRLAWPEVAGRVRIIAVVRAGGRLGFATLERTVGDGLGLDLVAPPAVRSADRLASAVLLDNGSRSTVRVALGVEGEGFVARGALPRLSILPGERREARVLVEARSEGALTLTAGDARLTRDVARIEDPEGQWSGRGATASYKNPARLPTPEQLGARDALLLVGAKPVHRFAAALQGLFSRPPSDPEGVAAVVLAARVLPELTRALGADAIVNEAATRLDQGMASGDPWVRVFSAHAALESGGDLAVAGRRVLAEVANQRGAPAAAPYARLLLARARQAVPAPDDLRPSSRPDAVTLSAVAEVLLDRAELEVLETLPIAPHTGERVGRFSPTLVDALTLFALEALPQPHPAASLLEAAIIGSARESRWTHPAEEALALVALAARGRRVSRRPYWGSVLLDGELVQRFNSKNPVVVPLGSRLGARPEITVTGAGDAEVGFLISNEPGPPVAGPLSIEARWTDEGGEAITAPVGEGETVRLDLVVANTSSRDEVVTVQVPLPAGLRVTSRPVGWEIEPGRTRVVVRVPASGSWSARFEARAGFAGVWRAPPIVARLRHGLAEVVVEQAELRIDASLTSAD